MMYLIGPCGFAVQDLPYFACDLCHGGVDHHISVWSFHQIHIAGRWNHRNGVIDLDGLFVVLAEGADRQNRSEDHLWQNPSDSFHRFLLGLVRRT